MLGNMATFVVLVEGGKERCLLLCALCKLGIIRSEYMLGKKATFVVLMEGGKERWLLLYAIHDWIVCGTT